MKKITYILALAIVSGAFNACSPWEDESYHPNDASGPTMLLKEMTTTYEGSDVVSQQVYEYDNEDRIKKITGYLDVEDMQSYTLATYTYVNPNESKVSVKVYMDGELFSESITESTVNGSDISITMSMNGEEMLTATGTISAPCGIDELIQNFSFQGQVFTSTSVMQYTDSNCSYKNLVDGELYETVTNDNKRNPLVGEQANLGSEYVSHNPLKSVDHEEGTTTEYVYVYNENNYPVSAVVTIKDASGTEIEAYTVVYVYYE